MREYVEKAKPSVIKVHLPVRLKSRSTPPWGLPNTKERKEEWTKKMRKKFSDPRNRVRATPENIKSLVSLGSCDVYAKQN